MHIPQRSCGVAQRRRHLPARLASRDHAKPGECPSRSAVPSVCRSVGPLASAIACLNQVSTVPFKRTGDDLIGIPAATNDLTNDPQPHDDLAGAVVPLNTISTLPVGAFMRTRRRSRPSQTIDLRSIASPPSSSPTTQLVSLPGLIARIETCTVWLPTARQPQHPPVAS